MISRRAFFGMFGAAAASGLLLPKKSIFLPPPGGWPRNALATMHIPRSDLAFYAEGLAAGRFMYDDATETMSVVQLDPHHHAGKFHSRTGRTYDWTDDEVPQESKLELFVKQKLPEPTCSKRAAIDDERDKPTPVMIEQGRASSEKTFKRFSEHAAVNLPMDYLPDEDCWPVDERQRLVMDQVRSMAINQGVPIVPGTYKVDSKKWYRTKDYKQFMGRA